MNFDYFWYGINEADPALNFRVFSMAHLIWLLITLAGIFICVLCYVKGNNKTRSNIRFIIALILIFSEFYKMSLMAMKGTAPKDYLPLEVCSLAEYMILIDAMWPDNRITKQLLAFAFFPAAVMALAFPATTRTPVINVFTLRFFLFHGGIAAYFLMRYIAGEIKPKYIGLWGSHAFFLGLALLMYPFDIKNGYNYMFVADYEGNPMLKILWDIAGGKGGPAYIFVLAVFVLLIFHLFYAFYRLADLRAGRKKNKQIS